MRAFQAQGISSSTMAMGWSDRVASNVEAVESDRVLALPKQAISIICHSCYHLTYEEVFSCRHATLS